MEGRLLGGCSGLVGAAGGGLVVVDVVAVADRGEGDVVVTCRGHYPAAAHLHSSTEGIAVGSSLQAQQPNSCD